MKKAIFVIVLFVVAAYIFGGGAEKAGDQYLAKIENKVADDAIAKYHIAQRNGSKVDVCLGAMMVTAAFLQAKDEANYAAWKKVQRADCVEAGMIGM